MLCFFSLRTIIHAEVHAAAAFFKTVSTPFMRRSWPSSAAKGRKAVNCDFPFFLGRKRDHLGHQKVTWKKSNLHTIWVVERVSSLGHLYGTGQVPNMKFESCRLRQTNHVS